MNASFAPFGKIIVAMIEFLICSNGYRKNTLSDDGALAPYSGLRCSASSGSGALTSPADYCSALGSDYDALFPDGRDCQDFRVWAGG
jgi:hypothetical protein